MKSRCDACGKDRYAERDEAYRAMYEIRQLIGPNRKKPKRVYECPYNGGWHLTARKTRPKSERPRKVRL